MAWGPQYLLPCEKWWPIHWPNEEWQVVPFPPAFDEFGNRLAPKPPDGTLLHWWQMPKDQWPQAAWEPKILGAWPASKVTMAEDLSIPSVWPGPKRAPPFGFIKLLMSGQQGLTKEQQISFMHMKIHTRPDWVSHFNHLKIISRDTPMGPRFYLMDQNWEQYEEYGPKKISAALKRMRQEHYRELLAAEIVRTKGKPQPSKDLFV